MNDWIEYIFKFPSEKLIFKISGQFVQIRSWIVHIRIIIRSIYAVYISPW